MSDSLFNQYRHVPLSQIDLEESLTDFSLSPTPQALATSIREIGLTHPPALAANGDRLQVISGHRRVRVCKTSGLSDLPAFVCEKKLDAETALHHNLSENRGHRNYSDAEKGSILEKLVRADVAEDKIIQKYMPMLGLERSKKLCRDYLSSQRFPAGLRQLLHDGNVPVRVWSLFNTWEEDGLQEVEKVFAVLRPGVNKWRELLELVEETARIESVPPATLLNQEEVESILRSGDRSPHEKYDDVVQVFYPRRYPVLSGLRKKVAQALDRLRLGSRTRIKIQESFEEGDIRIELKVRDQQELIDNAEKLDRAAHSQAMADLMRTLKNPELNGTKEPDATTDEHR